MRTNRAERPAGESVVQYEDHGTGSPLVFIHGDWASRRMWEPQIDHFASEYRVITLDIRGHGETGSTAESQYSIDLFVEDLRTLLVSLSVSNPVVCGLS
jgi:non-heme chloroperoxidase